MNEYALVTMTAYNIRVYALATMAAYDLRVRTGNNVCLNYTRTHW